CESVGSFYVTNAQLFCGLSLNSFNQILGAFCGWTSDDGNRKTGREFGQRRRVLRGVLPAGPPKARNGHLVETTVRLGLVGPRNITHWRTRLMREADETKPRLLRAKGHPGHVIGPRFGEG